MRRTKVVAVACTLLATASGCRPRAGAPASSVKADGESSAPVEAFAAEDLAVLLPVSRWDTDVAGLAADFPRLAEFLPADLYERILKGIVQGQDDEASPNPFAKKNNAALAQIEAMPLADWYVTGVRFVPCRAPSWPLPKGWDKALDPALCVPLVRLSAQRFGVIPFPGGAGELTTDDKALHLIFAFTTDAETGAAWGRFEAKVDEALTTRFAKAVSLDEKALVPASPEVFTVEDALAVVDQARTDLGADASARLQAGRQAFRALLSQVKGDAATGKLRIRAAGELSARDDRLRALLPTELKRHGTLLRVAFNFASTALKPGFSETWTLGAFRTLGGEVQPERLTFNAGLTLVKASTQTSYGLFRLLDSGLRESFTNTPGAKSSLDRELLQGINAGRKVGTAAVPPLVRDLLRLTGNTMFAAVGSAANGAQVADQAGSADAQTKEAAESYQQLHDPTLTDRQTSCLACHVASALRVVHGLAGIPAAVKDPANMNVARRGPGGVGQIEFTPHWVLRSLGYLGRMPCLNDRLVAEVEADLRQL